MEKQNEDQMRDVCLGLEKAYADILEKLEKEAPDEHKDHIKGLGLFVLIQSYTKYEEREQSAQIDEMILANEKNKTEP